MVRKPSSSPLTVFSPLSTMRRSTRSWWHTCRRAGRAFWHDDDGQDVVEYALLAALIGVLGVGVWVAIEGHLATVYSNYNTDVQNLWEPPAPGGGL